jgi:hypothetical protein
MCHVNAVKNPQVPSKAGNFLTRKLLFYFEEGVKWPVSGLLFAAIHAKFSEVPLCWVIFAPAPPSALLPQASVPT